MMVMAIIWYLLIATAFYLYGMNEINKTWDLPMFLCCLFWPLTFPSAVLLGLGLFVWYKIEGWWSK